MPTYSVKNGSSIGKAFKVDGGHQVIDAGKAGEVTTTSPLTEEQIDTYAADGVKVVEVKGKRDPLDHDADGKKGGAAPPPPPVEFVAPVGPYRAGESSPGWWAIFDGKDEPVGKKVRKTELEGFDTLSEDDKATFAIEHAKTAFEAEQKKV